MAKFVYVTFVLDESSSMASMMPEPVNGFNLFLEEQKALPGKCTLRLVKFDSPRYSVAEHPILEFPKLTTEGKEPQYVYKPGGATPLWDSVAKAIDDTGYALGAMPESERPDKVLFIILTDGEENSSKEFTGEDVKAKITTQTDQFSWQFVYLGVGLDQFTHEQQAASSGVPTAGTYVSPATQAGLSASYRTAGNVTSSTRS